MSEEQGSSSEKRRKIEETDGGNSKKIMLRVSKEETFEIELDKLTSKPGTMLGIMFSSNLAAKTNENGEYELKDVNPVVFKDILDFYEMKPFRRSHYREETWKTCEHLQIRVEECRTETELSKLYSLLHDSSMTDLLNNLYCNNIMTLKKTNNIENKKVIYILLAGAYKCNNEPCDINIQECDEFIMVDKYFYEAIGGNIFRTFLSSKGIRNFTVEEKQSKKWFYKVLKILYDENCNLSHHSSAFETFMPAMSDGEPSTAMDSSNKERNDSKNVKKVKLRVSKEETYQIDIELDELTSKPNTYLGKIFTSNLAQPNEIGEFELKDIDPVLFKNILSYYEIEPFTPGNYDAELFKTCDYLQVNIFANESLEGVFNINYRKFDRAALKKHGFKDLLSESLNDAYDSKYLTTYHLKMSDLTINDLFEGGRIFAYYHLQVIFISDLYEEDAHKIIAQIYSSYNRIIFTLNYLYDALTVDFFRNVLSSQHQRYSDCAMEHRYLRFIGEWFYLKYGKYGMDFKLLKIRLSREDIQIQIVNILKQMETEFFMNLKKL